MNKTERPFNSIRVNRTNRTFTTKLYPLQYDYCIQMDLLSIMLIEYDQDRIIKESSKGACCTFSRVDPNLMRFGKEAPKNYLIEIIK